MAEHICNQYDGLFYASLEKYQKSESLISASVETTLETILLSTNSHAHFFHSSKMFFSSIKVVFVFGGLGLINMVFTESVSSHVRLSEKSTKVKFYVFCCSQDRKTNRVDPLTSILAVLARSCQILTTSWQPWIPWQDSY